MFTRHGLALAVLLAGAGLAGARRPRCKCRPSNPPKLPVLKLPVMRHSANSIIGATVNLQGGSGVGTVHDFVLNDDGVVEYLIVSDNGKLVTVPWEATQFNFAKRTAVINISPEQYRQVPTYTAERYPDFATPVYRTQVYRSYGLTPGRERRIERREERRP